MSVFKYLFQTFTPNRPCRGSKWT